MFQGQRLIPDLAVWLCIPALTLYLSLIHPSNSIFLNILIDLKSPLRYCLPISFTKLKSIMSLTSNLFFGRTHVGGSPVPVSVAQLAQFA